MAKRTAAPNREILEAALQGLEIQKQKLDEQIAQVRALLGPRAGRSAKGTGGQSGGAEKGAGRGKRRNLSPEARKRIAAAQKKRWADFRKSQA